MQILKSYRFYADVFFCWFFALMLWLPSCVGGWLVYFDLLDAGIMWLVSFALSFFGAVYMAYHPAGGKATAQDLSQL